MHIKDRSGAVLLLTLAAFSTAHAHPAVEAAPRPVGVLEQPCPLATPAPTPAPASAAEPKDFYERLLDPSLGRELEPPDAAVLAAMRVSEEERLHNDWANLCRYRAENAALHHSTTPRVVFIGDSITEFWKLAHPEFFADGFLDRGIRWQTTGQMLVRFHQDVIALKPAVVHIMAGTSDFAGNGGPTSLEAIRNNIVSMVDLAVANDIRVVLGSVPPAGAFPWRPSVFEPAQHIVELNEQLRRMARERNLTYVDYHEPLADERDAMKETFSNDGVHPNRDGYSVMELLTRHAIDQALSSVNDMSPKGPPGKQGKEKTGSASH